MASHTDSTPPAPTVFDRQNRIPDWDQKVVGSQVALILGCGGLGCSVSLSCARLGFKKLILVDYDTVAVHNLNRQVLFSLPDVGKLKVRFLWLELPIVQINVSPVVSSGGGRCRGAQEEAHCCPRPPISGRP